MKIFPLFLVTTASLWSLSLDEAIERALQHSPSISKAQSAVRYAQSDEMAAQAAFHPTLDAGFNWQNADKSTAFSDNPSYRYNLTAKYNLFNGFADSDMVDAADAARATQELLLSARRSDLKLEVITAYSAVLKAQKAVETQQAEREALQRAYNDTKIRYEQGFIAKNELLSIDVEQLRSEQTLNALKSELVRANNTLERLLGGQLQRDEALEEITPAPQSVQSFEVLLDACYTQRSELKALQSQRQMLSFQHSAAGSLYPSVDLQADYIINDKERLLGTSVIQHKDLLQTMVTVSWNLYNGRADEARRKGILEKISSSDADIAAMKLDLKWQLSDAYEAYRLAQSAQEVASRAFESATENFRITNDRFEYGEVDTLTLLKAQSDLSAARNAYNNARFELFRSAAALERISGE